MPEILQILLNFLAQFTGGRGGIDHVIVNYVIAGFFWAVLFVFAKLRYKESEEAREEYLIWGFGFALSRELFMIFLALLQALKVVEPEVLHVIFPPFEHTLHNLSLVVIAAAFLRYLLDDAAVARRYLFVGLVVTLICYLLTFYWWAEYISANPTSKFGQVWPDWVFHISRSVLAIVPAVILWQRTEGWLRNSIVTAFTFFFIDAVLKLPDMALGEVYENIFTPISRSFYLVAIPIFGYVYLREQWHERKRAEVALQSAYSQLEALVEQRTAELRSSTEMTHAILDNAHDSIITVDVKGKILTINPATELLFGYSSQELLGQDIELIIPDAALNIPERLFSRSNEKDKRGDNEERRGGGSSDYNSESDRRAVINGRRNGDGGNKVLGITSNESCFRKDGTTFPAEISVSTVKLGDKRIYSGIIRDLTERVKVDKMKGEFVSVVSHELRTPLTSIKGSLDLVLGGKAGAVSDKVKKLINIASSNTKRLSFLINDILDIDKLESGAIDMPLERASLLPLLKQSIEANAGYASNFNVTLKLTDPLQEDMFIEVSADRFMQVMANLISNAVKFSPKGETVELSITLENNTVRVAVKDYGCGIPEDFKVHIFEKFSQADASSTREHPGTGLGLSITKTIIEKMNGSIGFESEVDKGTTFYFDLPVVS